MRLLLLILLFPFFGSSQAKSKAIPLISIYHGDDMSDLKKLDSIFSNRTIIGVGESTHGTSEFTTMRLRLFRYLVENHNFNTFFLEADYAACQRVNRYVHGSEDSVEYALLEVRLWPWLTTEMVELIEWMKDYNLKNNNLLSFIGCDMQLINSDILELKRILKPYDVDTNIINNLKLGVRDKPKDTLKINQAIKASSQLDSIVLNEQLNESDMFSCQFIQRNVKQLHKFALGTESQNMNLRDSCMADNMINYLTIYPNTKAIFFAHNEHVRKNSYSYENGHKFARAGWFLSEKLNNKYYSIALLTENGSFLSGNIENKDKVYAVTAFKLQKSKRNSVERILENFNQPLLFTESNLIKTNKRTLMTSIGAVYIKPNQRYRYCKKEMFDAFIFINTTSPTHLIERKR